LAHFLLLRVFAWFALELLQSVCLLCEMLSFAQVVAQGSRAQTDVWPQPTAAAMQDSTCGGLICCAAVCLRLAANGWPVLFQR
jgi:hypothetical protein